MSAPLFVHLDDVTRERLERYAAARGVPVVEAVKALPFPAGAFRLGAMVGTALILGDITGPLFEDWEPRLP